MSIGENIKAMRKAAGLTQRQVAYRLDVTESAVGQFERPDANPQGETLMKLAFVIGCSVQSFFDDDNSTQKETRDVSFPVLEKRARLLGMQIVYGTDFQNQESSQFSKSDIFIRFSDGFLLPVTKVDLYHLNEGLDFYMLAETQKLRKNYEEKNKA